MIGTGRERDEALSTVLGESMPRRTTKRESTRCGIFIITTCKPGRTPETNPRFRNVNFCRQLVRLQREHNNANSAEPAKRRERPSPPHRAAQAGVEMTRLGSPSSRSGGGSASNRDAQREVRPSERPRFRAIASSRPCSTLSSNRSVPDASATTRPPAAWTALDVPATSRPPRRSRRTPNRA